MDLGEKKALDKYFSYAIIDSDWAICDQSPLRRALSMTHWFKPKSDWSIGELAFC